MTKGVSIEKPSGDIVIYKNDDGTVTLDVKLENDTIWLTQDSMAKLYDTTVQNITIHIKNIYNEQELDNVSTCKNFLQVQTEGKRKVSRNRLFYNLDMILSVGYRIKSKTATQFRIWANKVLKEYLINGFALNKNKLSAQKEQFLNLQKAINVLSRSLENNIETFTDVQNAVLILKNFSKGLALLDDFDCNTLDKTGQTEKTAVKITESEYLEIINKMKPDYASDVFANPKDNSFASSINQIYATFDGKELYPSIEEKAAMLLYFITKNHSFTDGNKRIAASCFLYFLDKNNLLYKNKNAIIDNGTLFTLTILIAESKPEEMDTMKQIVVSLLNLALGGRHG